MPLRTAFIGKVFIGGRVNAVYARSPDGDGTTARLQRALVGGGIDTRCHARHDGNILFTQRPTKIFGNPHRLRRGMTAADNGGGRFVQQLHVTAQKQNRRRGNALRQHFRQILILQQQQTTAVLRFPLQRRFRSLLRQRPFFRVAPSFGCLLVAHHRGNLLRRSVQRGFRAAETLQQEQETLCADIRCKRQLQPNKAVAFRHEL